MNPPPAVKPPSLKERIENNLVVFFLGALLTGFLAGLGAYQGALKLVDYTTVSNESQRAQKTELDKRGKEIAVLKGRLKAAEAQAAEQHWLRVRSVTGLDGSRARVIVRVNGRAYSYPSRIPWNRLGPGMSPEEFPLPIDARTYEVSFELLISAGDNQFRRYQSQEVIAVRWWPFEGEYKIQAAKIDEGDAARGKPLKETGAIARVQFDVR
jgi:hypothetical protein